MHELNLPSFDIKIKKTGNLLSVWDVLRRKYVVLTQEEWVRQHFVNYLITEKNYPQSLIANEQQIILNNCKKRCDSVVYNNKLKPLAIVEYKAPEIKIVQETFNQIARYNMVLKVDYLIVSNGLEHYCCKIDYDNMSYSFVPEIPSYIDL